ncbi:hypothetical protein P170DRAFT_476884 [Aspergillus steynii IBT 23096]|uniref:Uncharacterized protein n=1 Tax=Aspergillus steynii IBT 23096 TaxID=1392250 RepID=A0A2I2G5W3_9EURO|nr:uncharacterized protein P170DRAFT_476884 [Aspergillus steynii IBT 23096]PLB48259.1 hypothetical protein P170DRAFT_476884 [Aspergillus steynii IBT 23096]
MEFLTEAETDFTDMIDQAMDARKLACVVPCRTEKPLSVEVDWDLWKISSAPLRDIELIKACYVDYRCTGMLLCYTDNKRCILGQWYESTRMQPDIQEMFLQHDEILRFYFARDDQNQLVTHVKALPDTAPVETEVVSIDIVDGDEIIWMFSGDHDIIYNGSE